MPFKNKEKEKRDYQQQTLRKIIHFKGRVLLAHEMRMGKTFIALDWLKTKPMARPAVVVCPEIGKLHWKEKAEDFYKIRATVLNGTKPPKGKYIHKNSLYIINWEILQYWVEFLQKENIKTLILDEVHFIKEPTTQCYKATKKLAVVNVENNYKGIPYILAMGGTPLKSRPIELFNIINLLRPDKVPSRLLFAHRYCNPKRKPWGWEFKGATRLDELHKNLNTWCMIRMLRKDKMNELPKERHIVLIPMSNEDEYWEAEISFIKWLSKRSITRAVKAMKAKRLVQMGYLKRLAASLKIKNVIKWIDRWLKNNHGKLVIFAIHKDIIKQLRERYEGNCIVVDGSVRGKKRHLCVKTFQTNKKYRIFIGNATAAGTVIELSKGKAVVMVELNWTPGDLTQCEDRIFDQKSKRPIVVYYLVAKDTIEHHLCKILQSKQDILSQTLDGSKRKNRLNIFDKLEKALLKGNKK